jgi:hypothetical protein
MLAAVYRRLGGALLGGEHDGVLFLNRLDDQVNGVEGETEELRSEEEPFLSSVIFGSIPALASYYAVVPKLADERGRQPVIYFETYMDRYTLPIASDVDRFFDALSHYIDLLVEDEGFRSGGRRELEFPDGVPELIARDRRLVEMLVTGRFDFLMNLGDEFQDWLARVKSA